MFGPCQPEAARPEGDSRSFRTAQAAQGRRSPGNSGAGNRPGLRGFARDRHLEQGIKTPVDDGLRRRRQQKKLIVVGGAELPG